jgi:hypothetical protein
MAKSLDLGKMRSHNLLGQSVQKDNFAAMKNDD